MLREEAEKLIERALRLSSADETFVSVLETDQSFLPFSANTILSGGMRRQLVLTVTVRIGDQFGTTVCNRGDEATLKEAFARASAIAAALPPSPDTPPFAPTRDIAEAPLFRRAQGEISAERKTGLVRDCIRIALSHGVIGSGMLDCTDSVTAIGTSRGLFAFQRASTSSLRVRMMNPDGICTGRAERWRYDFEEIDAETMAGKAAADCLAGRKRQELKPGRYDVILAPGVVADFLYFMLRQFNERDIREKMSFLTKMDGSSQLGNKLFPASVTIKSDPYYAAIPSFPFTSDGEVPGSQTWVKEGIITTLSKARSKSDPGTPVPFPTNIIMEGGNSTLNELIDTSPRAILISSVSNVRVTDATNCLLGGITRDGFFLIEEGRITSGLRNMHFSETPVYMLKGSTAFSVTEQTSGRQSMFPTLVPAIKMSSFSFTAPTDIV